MGDERQRWTDLARQRDEARLERNGYAAMAHNWRTQAAAYHEALRDLREAAWDSYHAVDPEKVRPALRAAGERADELLVVYGPESWQTSAVDPVPAEGGGDRVGVSRPAPSPPDCETDRLRAERDKFDKQADELAEQAERLRAELGADERFAKHDPGVEWPSDEHDRPVDAICAALDQVRAVRDRYRKALERIAGSRLLIHAEIAKIARAALEGSEDG